MRKASNILEKDTRKTHQQELFARIDLCFSISTWLKSYFTDILQDVKNSTIFGHFLEMCFSTVSRWLFFCAGPECLTGASFTAIRVEPKIREGKRGDSFGRFQQRDDVLVIINAFVPRLRCGFVKVVLMNQLPVDVGSLCEASKGQLIKDMYGLFQN